MLAEGAGEARRVSPGSAGAMRAATGAGPVRIYLRAAAVLGGGALTAALAAPLMPSGTSVLAREAALVLGPVAAALACLAARRQSPTAGGATWQILAIGNLLAAMSQALYARAEVLGIEIEFPSLAFHLLVIFHFALAHAAVVALRPAHEARGAAEIVLDGTLLLLGSSALLLRLSLDEALVSGVLSIPQVSAILVGQFAVAASVLFTLLLVAWRATVLPARATDALLAAAIFFAFGDLLLVLGLEVPPGGTELGSAYIRLAGWGAIALAAGWTVARTEPARASRRRALIAQRTRQVVVPAVPLMMAGWALDVARRGQVSSPSLVVISLMGVLLTARIALAFYATEQEERERRAAEALAADARLRAVTARMNPHFLFNALHSLTALVRRDTQATERAIHHLARLLRYGIETGDHLVNLEEEVRFARHYIEVEQLRLGDRLRFHEDVPAELRRVAVPAFVIQPLVENAVKHGVNPYPEGGSVWLRVRLDGEKLVVEVEDTGPGATEDAFHEARGVGIRALRAQLELHAPGEWRLEPRCLPSGGFQVRLELPADLD